MAKKNLSLHQTNAVNELAFEIDGYIQMAHPSAYAKFFTNGRGQQRGKYALKNEIFDALKCAYISSDAEEVKKLVRLSSYLYKEREDAAQMAEEHPTQGMMRRLGIAEVNVIMLEELLHNSRQMNKK